MNKFSPYVGLGLLIVITLATGLLQGKMTNRFGVPEDMNVAAKRLENLKKVLKTSFGPNKEWRMIATKDMTDLVVETLECREYINASFVSTKHPGIQVDGFIILGPPGPVAVHTPEICYSSRDYKIKGDRDTVRIFPEGPQEDEFWALTLRSNEVDADILRVYYGWADEGPWTAPDSPRITYGGGSKLFKMQLAVKLPSDAVLSEVDACQTFLQAFLPVVNSQLFNVESE